MYYIYIYIYMYYDMYIYIYMRVCVLNLTCLDLLPSEYLCTAGGRTSIHPAVGHRLLPPCVDVGSQRRLQR